MVRVDCVSNIDNNRAIFRLPNYYIYACMKLLLIAYFIKRLMQ